MVHADHAAFQPHEGLAGGQALGDGHLPLEIQAFAGVFVNAANHRDV
jgi:hypothetical protein